LTEEAWVVIGVNAAVVLFGGGGAYMRLKANSKTISELKGTIQDMKDKLWAKFDELDKREGRHYRRTGIALTALIVSTGNPGNPNKTAAGIVREMMEGDGS
jgi:hypothetical protein